MKKILSIFLAVAVLFGAIACAGDAGYSLYGKKVVSVTLTSAPDYFVGETVNPADVDIRVVFDDSTEATVTGQDVGMKTSDGSFVMAEGGLTFNFNYGVDDNNKAQSWSVVVKPVAITGLEIDPTNAPKEIAKGGTVDSTGVVYTAQYNNGEKVVSETLAESLVSGLTFTATGLSTAEVGDEIEVTVSATGSVKPVLTADWMVTVQPASDTVVGVRVEQDDSKEVFLLSKEGTKLSDISLIVTEVLADGTDGEVVAPGSYTLAFDKYETSYVLKSSDRTNTYSGTITIGDEVYKFDDLSFDFTTDYPKAIKVTAPDTKYEDDDTIRVQDFDFEVTEWQSGYDYATNKVTPPSFSATSVIEIASGDYVKAGTQTATEGKQEVTFEYVGDGTAAVTFNPTESEVVIAALAN